MKNIIVTLLGAVSTACTLGGGPALEKVPVAHEPGGAQGHITVDRIAVHGELIAVTDTAFLLLTPTGVSQIPVRAADRCVFRPFRHRCSETATWARVSRHPFGMSDALLRELLERNNQQTVRLIP